MGQKIPIDNNLQLQSPYLYCQAAGSDGSDDTETGIHLRWDFLHELGENHIAKGNLFFDRFNKETGFSKRQDFISIYRAEEFDTGQNVEINGLEISSYLPFYEGVVLSMNEGQDNLLVRFIDRTQFMSLVRSNNFTSLIDYLQDYEGLIEIEIEGKLLYRYQLQFNTQSGSPTINIETIVVGNRFEKNTERVIKREYAIVNNWVLVSASADNIKYIRFYNLKDAPPSVFTYFSYDNAFSYYQDNDLWEKSGDYCLTIDDSEAMARFSGDNGIGWNLNWAKFNEGVMLNPDNYADRWANEEDGLKKLVDQFIDLSDKDARANINLQSEEGASNTITISILDMLKLVSLDYHAARMLGLGLLDKSAFDSPDTKYIYAAAYTTFPNLPYVGNDVDHIFLTLPTNCSDYRLPLAPAFHELTYGLYVDTDNSGVPALLSDVDGYSFYDDTRFINLSKTNSHQPQKLLGTIPDNNSFDASAITQPSVFGIEYKEINEGEWRLPEILHDDIYKDVNGKPETAFTPENGSATLYVHKEKDPGLHDYALYAINWFNRVSDTSITQTTDETAFTKRNSLLPPANISVQYLQEEDPLIFTTQNEQNELAALNQANPSGDNVKTRVLFEWNEIQNMAYQTADRVEFFFREQPILKVEGLIDAVIDVSGSEHQCMITTKSYKINSVNPPSDVILQIPPSDQQRFIGSYVCTPDGQFKIISIQTSGTGVNPSFTIEKVSSLQAVQGDPNDPYSTMPIYYGPKANDIFYIEENTGITNSWQLLSKTVQLYQFGTDSETIYETDGTQRVVIVGGILKPASITKINQSVNGANVFTGGYEILFDANYVLPPLQDPDVSWFRGSVRLMLDNTANKKSFPVVSVVSNQPLKLIVFDGEYLTTSTPVKIGLNINVNYHPGYKVYLNSQANFQKQQLLPSGNTNLKKTFLSLGSVDTLHAHFSELSRPMVIVARNIQKPVRPDSLAGPSFATRPDFNGKSTYTLDVTLVADNRTPFGLAVYRATEMAVLQALYTNDTIVGILGELKEMELGGDEFRFQRWINLVNAITEDSEPFLFYKIDNDPFRFPNPDNSETEAFVKVADNHEDFVIDAEHIIYPFPLNQSMTFVFHKKIVKHVIENIFNSITETAIIFEYLKQGQQTSSAKPKVHDILGRLLNPSDPSFNPFPMAVNLPPTAPSKAIVRITDYTINGNARNLYFYFAREVSLTTQESESSDIVGPIILVDAFPPEAPKIRKVVAREANPYLDIKPAIQFELADYLESENIVSYQIFRAYNVLDAASTRTMKLATTDGTLNIVEDTFANLQFPPFGLPLYYRIVALRQIVNEQGENELIPSQPSEVFMTNILDSVNPPVPNITFNRTVDPVTGDLQNVKLIWPSTTFNGTYYVYKMNDKGNWEKLYSIKSNRQMLEFPESGNTSNYPDMALLHKTDEDGNTVYHRFKVSVENASGLFNLEENELIL